MSGQNIMLSARDDHRGPGPVGFGLLQRFVLMMMVHLGLLGVLVTQVFGVVSVAGIVAPLVVYALTNVFVLRGLVRHYPHRRIGLCNYVTHLRATLIAGLAAILTLGPAVAVDAQLAWRVVAVAAFALTLDAVDGWAARSSGLSSGFGARFDMEIDSILALILMLIVLLTGKVGLWVILLGVMRYLFVMAMWIWPWIDRPTPPRYSGKIVCVVQIAVLIAMIAPVVSPPLASLMAATALGLLIWSFGVDLRWLWQRRHA